MSRDDALHDPPPHDPDPTSTAARSSGAVDVVRRCGGRADYRSLRRHVSDTAIKRAVAAGDLLRVARGLYVLPRLPDPVTAAAACRGVVSHESAAALLGLDLLHPPRQVHVTAPRGARPPAMKGVALHRCSLEPREVTGHTTSLLRTVLDSCLSLPFREALAVADGAARRDPDLLTELDLAAHRPGPGRRRRFAVARAASPLAANPFESALRGELISAALGTFTPQEPILTSRGARYVVDLADRRRRIAIEADGFRWHGDPRRLTEDCRRYDDLVADGWLVLRFAFDHVVFEPGWLVDTVRRACRLRR